MHLALFGLNHKQAPIHIRDPFAAVMHRLYKNSLIQRSFPSVLISTCNRTELYFSHETPHLIFEQITQTLEDELDPTLWQDYCYSLDHSDAFLHLCS